MKRKETINKKKNAKRVWIYFVSSDLAYIQCVNEAGEWHFEWVWNKFEWTSSRGYSERVCKKGFPIPLFIHEITFFPSLQKKRKGKRNVLYAKPCYHSIIQLGNNLKLNCDSKHWTNMLKLNVFVIFRRDFPHSWCLGSDWISLVITFCVCRT